MSFDHRFQVKTLLETIVTTIDDGSPANIVVLYQGGPELLRWYFEALGMHAVITIERPTRRESGERRRIQDEPLRYNAEVPVHVMAINQGFIVVTATKLLNKIRLQIESIIEANAQQTGYTLIISGDRNVNMRIGGYDPLWRDDYLIAYRPMES